MRLKKQNLIVCPHCQAEYLPNEIYIPNYFLGTSKNVIKDDAGVILDFDNEPMQTSEEYCCDYCNNNFQVKAKVVFNTCATEEDSFTEEFTTSMNANNLLLKEDLQ